MGEEANASNEMNFANEFIEEEGEMITGATVEVEEMQLGPLSLFKNNGYDAATNEHDHLIIHELYQPLELDDGRFTCKICHQSAPETAPIFATKTQFTSHRYRFHGTFMNLLPCPEPECHLQFASIIALKKHLQSERNIPIESHYKQFVNMADFEIWRSTVEEVTSSRFILHSKQVTSKRNVLHCSRSEHKISSTSKGRNRLHKMRKAGSACPAHITFIENLSGSVDVIYQLFHYGHDAYEPRERGYTRPLRDDFFSQEEESLPLNTIFPVPNRLPKSAAMQYVQLSLLDMPDSLYLSTRYSQLLVVLDVQSYFIFARPIPNPRSVTEHTHKSHIIRQLVDIFTQFGCPLGFSVSGSSSVLFDGMESIEEVFNVNMTHVGNLSPDLSFLKKSLIQRSIEELSVEDRWPEVLPFVLLSHNSEGGGAKYLSPFELMFGRRPPTAIDAEQRLEEAHASQMNGVLGLRFEEGDFVLVRYFDPDLIAEGPTPNASQPQASTEYLNGLVGEVDWYGSPFYPYKVYICRSTEQPNTECAFIWISPFDVAPSVGDLRNKRNIQRRNMAASLLCTCSDEARAGERCLLPRSELCVDKMSRVCCEKLERPCEYHNEYSSGGGDTYKRIETLAKRFIMRDMYEKEDGRRLEEEEKMKSRSAESLDPVTVLLRGAEMKMEEEKRGETSLPPSLEKSGETSLPPPLQATTTVVAAEGDRGKGGGDATPSTSSAPSTSRVIVNSRPLIIASKKPAIRGVKRKTEEGKTRKEDGDDETKKTEESLAEGRPASGLSGGSGGGGEDRRKSRRVTKPNTLYKSFVVE